MPESFFTKISSIIQQLVRLISSGGQSLFQFVRTIDYSSRKTYVYAGGGILVIVGLIIAYRLLNPINVINTGDYGPFDSAEEYNSFLEQNPLFVLDEPSGKRFDLSGTIRQDKQPQYIIELVTIPAKPEMSDAYIQRYIGSMEKSQTEALDWIKAQGINPDKISIIWRPNPIEWRQRLLGETTKQVPQKNTVPTDTTTPTATPQPTTRPTSPATPTPLFPH